MKCKKSNLIFGFLNLAAFILWTILVQSFDLRAVGVNGTEIGFASLNTWFHSLTGVNMLLYNVTDWLGLVPVFVCFFYGAVGLIQLIKRRKISEVDFDIILLGIYYVIVIFSYIFFEVVIINYRPVLIDGIAQASYPSSTTLLVLSVMPTLVFQANRRLKNETIKKTVFALSVIFTVFTVVGRLLSGVHWLTDIVGSVFLSIGLFCVYRSAVIN